VSEFKQVRLPTSKNAYLLLIVAFVAWRSFLFLVAYYSPFFISSFGDRFPYKMVLANFNLPYPLWTFANFDGVHYIRIAQDGYEQEFTQAFFPFYPILIKLFSYITFDNFLFSSLVLSNVAFLAGLILFYRMVCKIYDKKIAAWSAAFVLTFPTSFYFGSAYSESLFFLLIISYFYLIYKKRIILASLVGAFASATRLIGIFLIFSRKPKLKISNILPILIIPTGLLSYMLYLTLVFKNPFYFISAQQVFGQERSVQGIVLLPQIFWRYFKIITTTSGVPLMNASLELISTVFALALLIFAYKKVKREWLVFSLLAVLLPTLSGTLVSMPRYILVAFPIYVVLAQIRSTLTKVVLLSIFLTALAVLTLFYTRGYWIA